MTGRTRLPSGTDVVVSSATSIFFDQHIGLISRQWAPIEKVPLEHRLPCKATTAPTRLAICTTLSGSSTAFWCTERSLRGYNTRFRSSRFLRYMRFSFPTLACYAVPARIYLSSVQDAFQPVTPSTTQCYHTLRKSFVVQI